MKEALANIKVWQNQWVGRYVTRYFKDGRKLVPFRALVVEYLAPEEKGDVPLWHILHEDKDEEDLEEHEVREGLENELKAQKERKRRAADESEEEEEEEEERTATLWPHAASRQIWRATVCGSSGGDSVAQPSAATLALCLIQLVDHLVAFGVCSWKSLSGAAFLGKGASNRHLLWHEAVGTAGKKSGGSGGSGGGGRKGKKSTADATKAKSAKDAKSRRKK